MRTLIEIALAQADELEREGNRGWAEFMRAWAMLLGTVVEG